MKIGIVIPARLQSERLPNKVLRPFLGKVMIEHVWKRANLIEEKAEIVVATDSLEIKTVCETFGANVILTSESHQNGLSRTGEIAKILNWDFYVILQADEILIDPRNLELLIKTIKEENSSPFYNLITNLKFDYEFFSFGLEKDLWFNSDIPIGYGLGSSGALCAAIYDKFATVKSIQIEEIMLELAEIERFFHGQSSGIDPLVSFLKKSIVIDNEKKVKIYDDLKFENLRGEGAIFVIDTKISRSTTNLVEYYKSLKINSNFKNEFINPLSHLVSLAIEQFLKILNDLSLNVGHLSPPPSLSLSVSLYIYVYIMRCVM